MIWYVDVLLGWYRKMLLRTTYNYGCKSYCLLAERCNYIASSTIAIRCRRRLSSLSVTRVYCDKTAEAGIMQFLLKCSAVLYLFACQVDYEIPRGSPWSEGLKLGWGGFWLRDAIPPKRCEIELRWQLITSLMGSHIWAFDCNKSWWPWMTLNVNSLLFHTSAICILSLMTKL